MIEPGLTDRVVLVTGGNNPHGIGAAIARHLAAQEAAVFIHYYRLPDEAAHVVPEASGHDDTGKHAPDMAPGSFAPDTPGLSFFYAMQKRSADEVVEEIRQAGGRAAAWEADLGDPAALSELFDRAEQAFGPVEVLVNNAAHYQADTFLPGAPAGSEEQALWEGGPETSTVTADSHDRHFAVNTRAPVLLMAEFVRRHVAGKRTWGRIVNISADCAEGSPAEISYRASKYALESYSRSAAAELGPLGITVNVVAPGPIQTGYLSPEFEEQVAADIPLGRVGRPEDIANAVLMLASEQAGWITGQRLLVHGGHRMAY
ncbi:SDR family NAD(P)-dependent oxidoreductase [Gemmatimonadota bacterium]